MSAKQWLAVLPLMVAAAGLLAGCEGDSPPPQTLGLAEDESALRELAFADIVAAVFEAEGRTGNGERVVSADGSSFRSLGRLIGSLTAPARQEMAVFVEYQPSPGAGTGGPSMYVVFVGLGEQGEPVYQPLNVVSAAGDAVLPAGEAVARGLTPFRQGTPEGDAMASIKPALLLDLEGDGVEELALRRQLTRNSVSWERLDVYKLTPGALLWSRVNGGAKASAPALAVVHYWADVSAAVGIARRWEPQPRLITVWSWLADEEMTDPSEAAAALVSGGDAVGTVETAAALRSVRGFFQAAHARLSEDFRVRQPWPGFINGFKNSEGVQVLEVSPPRFGSQGRADLDVLLDLTEQEGPEAVTRRFLVETELVQEDGEWFLDGVEATEQRE